MKGAPLVLLGVALWIAALLPPRRSANSRKPPGEPSNAELALAVVLFVAGLAVIVVGVVQMITG